MTVREHEMLKGIFEVCYHKEDDTQHSKKIASFSNSGEAEKSFHLEFKYGDKIFLLSLYHDVFGLHLVNDDGEIEDTKFSYEAGDSLFPNGINH